MIDNDASRCWTAGCDDDANWLIALYNHYPFNTGPVLPIKARCRTHTFEVRAWWLNRHNGEIVIGRLGDA